ALSAVIEKDVSLSQEGAREAKAQPRQDIANRIALSLEKRLVDPRLSLYTMPAPRPVLAYAFFAAVGVLCAGFFGNEVIKQVRADDIRQRVADILSVQKDIVPSQVQVRVLDDGRLVSLSGYVPSQAVADQITNTVTNTVHDVVVENHLI